MEDGRALVEAQHREAVERLRGQLQLPIETSGGIPYTELAPAKPGEVFSQEWNTYRREVGRLLAQGQEGQYLLIKGDMILGLFGTWEAAREAGLKRFLLEPFFVHPVRAEEPFLRVRGINFPCPS